MACNRILRIITVVDSMHLFTPYSSYAYDLFEQAVKIHERSPLIVVKNVHNGFCYHFLASRCFIELKCMDYRSTSVLTSHVCEDVT